MAARTGAQGILAPEAPEVSPRPQAAAAGYRRYHIATRPAPDVAPHPSRFRVKVRRHRLARLILGELFHYRNQEVVLSRPCLYGVFSGPVGGFWARESLCVGCLRCTTQYPEIVQILPNPRHRELGDSYFLPANVEAIAYEARTGRVPVRGAGYRGLFGGEGWDGLWLDMSEIVRPTRDGIHGREFISTVVDIGSKPGFLRFDESGAPAGPRPHAFSIPLPLLFDLPAIANPSPALIDALTQAAQAIETLVVLPLALARSATVQGAHLVPRLAPADVTRLAELSFTPRLVELDGWQQPLYRELSLRWPDTVVAVRLPLGADLETQLKACLAAGVRVFHLTANHHGRGADGAFMLDLIRRAHGFVVRAGCRDEVTLLGSGGLIAAEHVPKAIACGLDAVGLDTALLVALQCRWQGERADTASTHWSVPRFEPAWGAQRLQNLAASWRDQLLEVLGAMGLREVRRLRGEMGRTMLQAEVEREAFAEISGYV